uniref:Uncharacterized protein n=1 Tax=Triticum urartu TaxID=4572 RepID=A0A8R7UY78_TRIUA
MTIRLEHYGTLIGVDFYRGGDMLSPLPSVALEDLSDSKKELVGSCFYTRGADLNYQQMYFT